MSEIKKGLIKDLPNEQYHADLTHLSSSNLKLLNGNAADLQKFYDTRILKLPADKRSSSAFDIGSYLHSLILEPHLTDSEFAFYKGAQRRNKEGEEYTSYIRRGKEFEFFKSRNEGKTVLGMDQKEGLDALYQLYLSNPAAVDILAGGDSEVSLFGDIKGVKTKVRADKLNIERRYIVDIKTTSFDITQEAFKETMLKWGYPFSSAMYLRMFEEFLGFKLDFYYVVIGKEQKGCEVFKLSDKTRLEGNADLDRAISMYKKCVELKDWTGGIDLAPKTYDNGYEILEV